MGHLDDLWEKYRDQGLVVLAVTNENRSLVDRFIEETKAKHPIVIEDGNSLDTFGGGGFPSSYLIDAQGRIAWAGHPAGIQDAQIEKLLADVRLLPKLPKSLSSAAADLDKGKFADAREDLTRSLTGENLSPEDRKAAEEAVGFIDWKVESLLEGARAAAGKGDFYAASLDYEELCAQFKGLPAAKTAEEELDEILRDKEKKREISAGETLDKMADRLSAMKSEKAAAWLTGFARKYDGTLAAKRALEKAAALSKAR